MSSDFGIKHKIPLYNRNKITEPITLEEYKRRQSQEAPPESELPES